ncbi:DUF2267 domain-containing protein [Actinoplanes sp. NPDC051411]|uniref:DUF2267 domain-containing protein n=1 Tax=Actinoplanes sp. NPDC051411 TaxID=3155522 RepID=UPI003424371B
MGNRGQRLLLEGEDAIQVDDEDLLARVQHRGRLHGRNESRRAVCAVVEALGEFLSARAFHLLAEQLPLPVRHRPPADPAVPTSRTFLAGIARRLLMDGPDAAFTARIVLEELNATGRVITPARFAHLVAPDLRPLLGARRAPVTASETNPAPRRVIRVTPAPVRPVTARPATPPAVPTAAASATGAGR